MAQDRFHYFVDGIKYDTDTATISGAEIKAMINGLDPSYQLFLEGHGDDPDRQISDGESIALDPAGQGVRKLYTVPPATFGR